MGFMDLIKQRYSVRAYKPDPVEVEPVAFTPLGYPADEPGSNNRKEVNELVRYGRW